MSIFWFHLYRCYAPDFVSNSFNDKLSSSQKHTIEANYVDADYAAADGDGDGDDYDYVDNLII